MNLIKLLLLLFIGIIINSLKLYLHFIGCFHNNIISTGQFVPCDKNLFPKLVVLKYVNDGVVKRRRCQTLSNVDMTTKLAYGAQASINAANVHLRLVAVLFGSRSF